MLPRTEVATFDLRRTLGENLAVAERTAHSRYPLVDGDLDHVLGVIHMKDLFWQLKEMELSPQGGRGRFGAPSSHDSGRRHRVASALQRSAVSYFHRP